MWLHNLQNDVPIVPAWPSYSVVVWELTSCAGGDRGVGSILVEHFFGSGLVPATGNIVTQ